VNVWFVSGALLLVAQLIGIYALMTRKADLIFTFIVGLLLVAAVVIVGNHVYHRLH
jgi:hypothetical protein